MERASPYYGYTRDQFYRRVHILTRQGVISPLRGRHNRILFNDGDELFFIRLRGIENEYPEYSFETCLKILQGRLLEGRINELESEKDMLKIQNRALSRALVVHRRWSLRRVFERVVARLKRIPP